MLTPKAHKIAIHIAFVVLAVWLVLQSSVLPQTIRINGGGYTAGHDESEKQLIDRRIADYTFASAFFTGVLALSTIALWLSTRALWKTTRDEFLSTHRPRLIVRQFVLQPPVVNDKLKVDFSMFNVGNTEATVRGIAAEVALWNGRFWEAPGIDPNVRSFGPKVVRNGERISVTIMSRFNLTATQLTAIQRGTFTVCGVGEFTYTDALGTERRTGFRRNYNVAKDMFIASPNEDQEYQD